MKKRGLAVALCMIMAGLTACTGENSATEQKESTQKEVIKETEKSTQRETEKETPVMTEKDTKNETQKETQEETTEVDLSGIHPDAVREIQGVLDEINQKVSDKDENSEAVIAEQAVYVMGLATGNSLVEDQVEKTVEAWKQKKTQEEWESFVKKYQLVYEKYQVLCGDGAKAELEQSGWTEAVPDYCGNGALDMAEWLHVFIK